MGLPGHRLLRARRPGSAIPDGFRYLVDRLHQAGVGVILDWVPAHFPKDEWALARFDGTPLYEHADPRRGDHPDWGTYVFDYGRPEVRNFLVANALYWCAEFHVDGLRVDAVASMLYLDYSREDGEWQPERARWTGEPGRGGVPAGTQRDRLQAPPRRHDGGRGVDRLARRDPADRRRTVSASVSSGTWAGCTTRCVYVGKEPVHRQWHHHQMTFAAVYAWSENFVLPISHDEVVHGKRSLVSKVPGDPWRQRATVRALLAFMWSFPGKQLLFMGCELADEQEWSEERGLNWALLDDPAHARRQPDSSRDLNAVYRSAPPCGRRTPRRTASAGSSATTRANNTFAFERRGSDGSVLVCVVNFAAVPHENYRIGLPRGGTWHEIINTDADVYGGSGVGNLGTVHAEDIRLARPARVGHPARPAARRPLAPPRLNPGQRHSLIMNYGS